MRGVAADFVRSDLWRVNLALRIDRGRKSGVSAALTGLPDIRSTVRGRLIVTRALGEGWSTTAGLSADILGRGGGTLMDFGIGKGFVLPWTAPWRKPTLTLGATVTAADRRYMQSYFGITEQQSLVTGYPVYSPTAGARDAALGFNVRSEFGNRWIGYLGMGWSRLIGPAAASPLSQQPTSWAVNGGVAWQF